PANLDQGAVQHLGSQALEAADALLRAPSLPGRDENLVYADIFGRWMIAHKQATGWVLLALAAALGGFAAWRSRRGAGLTAKQVGLGALDGLWFLAGGVVLLQATRLLAGPMSSRAASPDVCYTLLRRVPWMEAGAVLVIAALALVLHAGTGLTRPRLTAGPVASLTAVVLIVGGFSPAMLVAGVVAVGLSLGPGRAERSAWGGWLGLITLVFVFGCALQAAAPEAALLFVWPVLLAAAAAALAALIDPGLTRPLGLLPAAVA